MSQRRARPVGDHVRCEKCGQTNPAEAQYCGACGSELPGLRPVRLRRKSALIAAAGALFVLLLIAGIRIGLEVKTRADDAAFRQARRADTLQAYVDYTKKFPRGLHFREAVDLALHCAARTGDCVAAQALIAKGANVNARGKDGVPPLRLAAAYSKNMTELLIAKGADVNAADNRGLTPLHAAAATGQVDCAQILIDNGADVNVRDSRSACTTPLHLAVSAEGDTAKILARTFVAKILIDHGADVNAKDTKQGWTPLHDAVAFGNKAAVKLLISSRANTGAADVKGITPGVLAFAGGDPDMMDLLGMHDSAALYRSGLVRR